MNRLHSNTCFYLAALLCLVCNRSVSAQTHTWNSAATGSWSHVGLWDVSDVPDESTNVVLINAIGPVYSVNYNLNSATIQQLTTRVRRKSRV